MSSAGLSTPQVPAKHKFERLEFDRLPIDVALYEDAELLERLDPVLTSER